MVSLEKAAGSIVIWDLWVCEQFPWKCDILITLKQEVMIAPHGLYCYAMLPKLFLLLYYYLLSVSL